MPKIQAGTDLGLYVNKTSAEQRQKRTKGGVRGTPGKLASNAAEIMDNAVFAKDNGYTMAAGNKLDDEALVGAKADFMSWMLGSGSTNATWGYDMSDPEDLQRFTSGQISKKYEAGYGDDEYSQWLKANGQAQADYFDSKYYANAYKSVLVSRANQELAKRFYDEVKQEAWRTAEDVSSISGDDIAEVAQNWKATHPEYANINILNTTDEKTIDDYSGYAAPEAAYNEYLAGLDKKRTDGIYLSDLVSDLEKLSAKVGAYKQKTMEDANALYEERTAATAQMRNQSMPSGSSYIGRGADKLYDTTTAARNARRKAEEAENSYNKHVTTAIDQTGYKPFATGQLDEYVGQGMNVEANNAKVSVDKQKAVDVAITAMRDNGMSTYEIKQTLNKDGRLSYYDSSEAKTAEITRKTTEAAMDTDLSHMLTGMDSELAEKAKRVANNSSIIATAPISQSDRWVMANTLSDEEQERIKDMMGAARLGLESKGYSGFEIDNCMRRNDLGEWLDETQAQDNYIDVMLDEMGLGESEKAKYKETLTAEDRANVAKDMTYSPLIENSAYDQTVRTVESIPVRAAFTIASGAVGFADMVEADGSGRQELWAVTEHLNDRAAFWQEYGHDSNHEFLSTASDVGSEILRMYATALVGKLAGAAVTGISAATKGTTAMLGLAKTVGYIPFISGAVGGYYTEAMQSGANIEDATRYALIAGTAEGVLEKMAVGEALQGRLGSTFLGKKFLAGNRSALVKGLFTKYGAPLADVLASAVGEGLEEYGSYWASALARSATWDTDFEGNNAEAMQNAAMGFIMGGIMSGLSAPANSQRYKYAMYMFNKTGEYSTDVGRLDSLYAASFVESLPEVQRNAYKQKYDAGEITADTDARKKSIEAEAAITKAEVQKKNYTEQHEKRLADIKAEPDKQQADVDAIQNRIANLQTLSYRDKGRQLAELFKQLRSAKAQHERAVATAESRAAAANTEYKAAIAELDNDIANANEVIGNYQAAKYFADAGKTAQNAPVSVSDTEVNTNSAEVANVDSAAINKVQNSENNINEATTAQDDANTVQNAQVEEAAVPEETTTEEVAAPVQQATVTAEQPTFAESKTVTNTLTKAFGEDTVAAFEEQFPGMDEHEVLSEKRSLEIAANKIEAEGIDKVEYDLLDEKHIWGDGDVDAAMSIIGQRLAAGDADSAAIMAETLAEHETKVGQQIQALAKYSRTPEGMILEAQKNATNSFKNGDPKVKKAVDDATTAITSAAKNGGDVEATVNSAMKGKKESTRKAVVEKVQNLITKGDVSKNKIQNIVKEASGVPVLTEADIQQILEYMEVYKTSDDERTAKEAAYRAGRIVASKQGEGTTRQKLRAISYMNMLLNLKTGAKNFAANAPMAVLETVKDIPGTLIDKAVSKKLGTQRTTTIASKGRFATMAKSFGKGISDAWLDMRHDVDTSSIPGRVENVRANTFKSEAMNRLERFVGQYMQLGDRGWAQMAYDGRIEELRSLGVDVNTPEAAQDAELYMLDRVFQNNSELAQRAIKARNAFGVFGDLILPFARTPANITDKLLDYSPVGLARATIQWCKTAGTDAFDQKTFVDRVSRSLTGTGTLMLGVAMAAKGLITDEPEDQEGREMYKNAGVNSYAINVGGTYHTINWAEPAGSLLIMGATLYNLFGAERGMQEASLSSVVTDTLKVGINAFVSNSFLSSVADMFESGSVGDSVEDTLVSSTSRLTASQGAAIAKLFDDYERETYDPDAIKQQMNYLISRIPGLRETLPVKIATDGTPMEATTGKTIGERFYNNLINPGYYTKQTDDPINSEIYRLYEAGYTEQMLPTAFYTVNKHKLTADERHEYQKVLGTACYNAASKVVQSANYKAADDKAKTDMLNEAIADAIKSKDVKDFKSNLGK